MQKAATATIHAASDADRGSAGSKSIFTRTNNAANGESEVKMQDRYKLPSVISLLQTLLSAL